MMMPRSPLPLSATLQVTFVQTSRVLLLRGCGSWLRRFYMVGRACAVLGGSIGATFLDGTNLGWIRWGLPKRRKGAAAKRPQAGQVRSSAPRCCPVCPRRQGGGASTKVGRRETAGAASRHG